LILLSNLFPVDEPNLFDRSFSRRPTGSVTQRAKRYRLRSALQPLTWCRDSAFTLKLATWLSRWPRRVKALP